MLLVKCDRVLVLGGTHHVHALDKTFDKFGFQRGKQLVCRIRRSKFRQHVYAKVRRKACLDVALIQFALRRKMEVRTAVEFAHKRHIVVVHLLGKCVAVGGAHDIASDRIVVGCHEAKLGLVVHVVVAVHCAHRRAVDCVIVVGKLACSHANVLDEAVILFGVGSYVNHVKLLKGKCGLSG